MSIVETESTTVPSGTAPTSPATTAAIAPCVWRGAAGCTGSPRGEYLPARISRRCKIGSDGPAGAATGSSPSSSSSSSSYRRLASMLSWSKTGAVATTAAASATGGGDRPPSSSYRRLASSLSRSLRWKRLPGLPSISLRAGSASAVLDEVAFRVMYVVEAVVLGLALSCFFLCCGCHI